jgi:hypothetical protein
VQSLWIPQVVIWVFLLLKGQFLLERTWSVLALASRAKRVARARIEAGQLRGT